MSVCSAQIAQERTHRLSDQDEARRGGVAVQRVEAAARAPNAEIESDKALVCAVPLLVPDSVSRSCAARSDGCLLRLR